MLNTRDIDTPAGRVHGIEANLRDMEAWHPMVTQVRDLLLRSYVVGPGAFPNMDPKYIRFCPTQEDVEEIAEGCHVAMLAGRLIDFGDWTQDVIKHGGNRGGPLYNRGAIGHPFRSTYLFMHTWENETAIYMVNPLEPDVAGGDCEIVELQPISFGRERVLMIGDRVLFEPPKDDARADDYRRYHCSAIPSVWRYIYADMPDVNLGAEPANAAAGNVLDPLMTALLILNTRGIVRETVQTPPKLAKARKKNGKPPIPPYDRVLSAPYVTAIAARRARGRQEPKGGHHASPIPHLRMGHPRTYANGTQTFVRDALVNMGEEAKKAWMTGNRSHYVVKP